MKLVRLNESMSDESLNRFKKGYRYVSNYLSPENPHDFPMTDVKLVDHRRHDEFVVLTDTNSTIAVRSFYRKSNGDYGLGDYIEVFTTTMKDSNGNAVQGTYVRHNNPNLFVGGYVADFYDDTSLLIDLRNQIRNIYNRSDNLWFSADKFSTSISDDDPSHVAWYEGATGYTKFNPYYPDNIPAKLRDSFTAYNNLDDNFWSGYRNVSPPSDKDDLSFKIEINSDRLKKSAFVEVVINQKNTRISISGNLIDYPDLCDDLADALNGRNIKRGSYPRYVQINRPLKMRDFRVIEKIVKSHNEIY